MKTKIRSSLFIAVGSLLLLVVGFQNCSPKLTFSEIESNQSSARGLTPNVDRLGTMEPEPELEPRGELVKIEREIVLNEILKADILFVIDNSGSMVEEQQSMSERFPKLIEKLAAINWKAGIITTDPRPSQYLLPYSDGKLLVFPHGQNFIDSSLPRDTAQFYFAQTIQRPEQGDGYEQGIAMTFRFVERDLQSPAPFIRNNSSLNIVYISDANETGTTPSNDPYALLAFLRRAYPGKIIQTHSIVVPSGDTACLGVSQNEEYGTRYENLATLTGGVKGSVCAKDYVSQLTFISEKIKDQIKTISVDCDIVSNSQKKPMFRLADSNNRTLEIEKIQNRVAYLKNDLPVGKLKMEYYCRKNSSY